MEFAAGRAYWPMALSGNAFVHRSTLLQINGILGMQKMASFCDSNSNSRRGAPGGTKPVGNLGHENAKWLQKKATDCIITPPLNLLDTLIKKNNIAEANNALLLAIEGTRETEWPPRSNPNLPPPKKLGQFWLHLTTFFLLRRCHLQTLQGSATHTGLWSGSIFHVPPLAHTNIRCKVSPAMSVLGKMPTSQDASRRPNPSCNCHPCPPSTAGLIDAAKIPSSWCA